MHSLKVKSLKKVWRLTFPVKPCLSHLSLTGVKPFKCNVCDASFTTNGSLNRHMIIHIKSFKCSMCDESFRTSLLCKKHMKKEHAVEEQSEDGLYSFRCFIQECEKDFKRKCRVSMQKIDFCLFLNYFFFLSCCFYITVLNNYQADFLLFV